MLVLSRKRNERIHVGDEVTVTVMAIRGNKVRLGIEAPPHLAIVREELLAQDDDARQWISDTDAA